MAVCSVRPGASVKRTSGRTSNEQNERTNVCWQFMQRSPLVVLRQGLDVLQR